MFGMFRHQRRISRSRPRSLRRHRLAVEPLEDRCLLSTPPPGIGPLPAVTIGLTAEQVAHADAVIDWNATMLRAIWTDATPPTLASRVEAMVGVAVYDAVEGIHPIYDLYPVPGLTARPAPDALREAAAIAAADTVLNSLYPDLQAMFAMEYQATLANVPNTRPKADGLAWGQTVANAVLAWRSQDGWNTPSNYQAAPPGGPPGEYELTPSAGMEAPPPPGYEPPLTPQWGQVTPWAMTSLDQFPLPGPPALDSAEYAADFNDVKSLGDINSTTRTQDETLYAHFWADVPGHSVTPPGHWDEIAEHISLQQHLNLEQNAHLFGVVNIGLADAAINCWGFKYIDNFWRPITAIRDARASQINPMTSSDPNWTPLWNTPPFPGYASGHSTFSGTASTILASIFGDHFSFTNGSDDMPGYSRSFTSLAQAADEAGESRVVGGIHFAFDNADGLAAGRQIGSYIAANFLLFFGTRAHQGTSQINQFFGSSQSPSLATAGAMDWLAGLSSHAQETPSPTPATYSAASSASAVAEPGDTTPTDARTLLQPTSDQRLTSEVRTLPRHSNADNFWEMPSDF